LIIVFGISTIFLDSKLKAFQKPTVEREEKTHAEVKYPCLEVVTLTTLYIRLLLEAMKAASLYPEPVEQGGRNPQGLGLVLFRLSPGCQPKLIKLELGKSGI
jgi:hypothetical protein